MWYRDGLLLVFDELGAKHFVPKSVHLVLNSIGKWARTWPKLADVLNVFWRLLSRADHEYFADAPLYEALAPVLPDEPPRMPDLRDDVRSHLDDQDDDLPDGRVADFL